MAIFRQGFVAALVLGLVACSGGGASVNGASFGTIPSTVRHAASERGRMHPRAAHFLPFEKIYVADGNINKVSVYQGNTLVRTVTQGISSPRALAVDSQGYLYVANATNVTAYGNGSSTVIGTYSTGLAQPTDLFVDSNDYLYVSDNSNNVVQVYSPHAAHFLPFRTLSSGLNRPHGIAVDANGHVFVANYGSDSVTVFKPNSTAVLNTITQGIHGPRHLAVTPGGDLVVSNTTGNNGNGSISAYAAGAWATMVNGDTTYTSIPQSICFDSQNNMYVSQKNGNVVNVYPNILYVTPQAAHFLPFQIRNGMSGPSDCGIDDDQTTLSIGNQGTGSDVALTNLGDDQSDIVMLPVVINQSPAAIVYGP